MVCCVLFGVLYCVWENRVWVVGKCDYCLEGLIEEEVEELGSRYLCFCYWI